jgi:hypothetical protein
MKKVIGYVVEEFLSAEKIVKSNEVFRELLKSPDLNPEAIEFLNEHIDDEKEPYWLCHWSRENYIDAVNKKNELMKTLPNSRIRVAKAEIIVNDENMRISYTVIPWK